MIHLYLLLNLPALHLPDFLSAPGNLRLFTLRVIVFLLLPSQTVTFKPPGTILAAVLFYPRSPVSWDLNATTIAPDRILDRIETPFLISSPERSQHLSE
jgi:hypothetical protein